jgi:3-deoxy-D-manno-octulosonate 8-phosphate phosphatase (KDO 8-P phosphatase)
MPETDYGSIDLLVLDVDGVLTDGRIVLTPDGDEIKSFHVRDGSGMKYWKRVGKKLAIISGRGSPAVTRRAEELGVDAVRLNSKDKLTAFDEILDELDTAPAGTAVIGDDLTDIPLLVRCGFAAVVPDAPQEAKDVADYVTSLPGGGGCVREVIELILKGSGLWESILARYRPPAQGRER